MHTGLLLHESQVKIVQLRCRVCRAPLKHKTTCFECHARKYSTMRRIGDKCFRVEINEALGTESITAELIVGPDKISRWRYL